MRKGTYIYIGVSLAIISLLSLGLAVDNAAAREKIKFTAGNPWVATMTQGRGHLYFAKRMKELSNGDITVKHYWSGSVVKGKTEIDCLKNRIVDFSVVLEPFHPDLAPEVDRVAWATPFLTDLYSAEWIFNETNWHKQWFIDIGIRPLFNNFQEQILALKTPIDDIMHPKLNGRKIRSPGLGYAQYLKVLGGINVAMVSAELPTALATGIVDGASFSIDNWEGIGMSNILKWVYILQNSFSVPICMLEDRYQELPDWVKKIIDQAAKETNKYQFEKSLSDRDDLVKKYKDNPDVHLIFLTEDQMSAWGKALRPYYEWLHKEYDPEISRYIADCRKAWKLTHKTPLPIPLQPGFP